VSFLQKQGGRPWHTVKVKDLLCLPFSGTKKKLEADAVDRLLRGIEWLEEEQWVSLLIVTHVQLSLISPKERNVQSFQCRDTH
jgi:hypothetical protein